MSVEAVIKELDTRIPPDLIKKRKGGGNLELSYIEGHEVIRQLNRILGHGNWQSNVKTLNFTAEKPISKKDYKSGKEVTGFGVSAFATVEVTALIGEKSVTFSDVGAGKGVDYGMGLDAHESAGKEAVTDAFKRAARHLGERLGLCLYDKGYLQDIEDGNIEREDTVPVKEAPKAVAKAEATGDIYAAIGSLAAVLLAQKKITKPELVTYLKNTYNVEKKEDLSAEQATEFHAFLKNQLA